VTHVLKSMMSTLLCVSVFIGCTPKTGPIPKTKSQSKSKHIEPHANDHKVMVAQKLNRPKWLFIGDSLTAGYGLDANSSYVAILQRAIEAEAWVEPVSGQMPKLINAGVSGDTSAGALRRVSWLLADQPTRVFLCIGANDGLRGQPVAMLKKNLNQLISIMKEMSIEVHLIGMQVPPNYGAEYSTEFTQAYQQVAEEQQVNLYPFLLANVAGVANLNQSDGIHPNREGHQVVAQQFHTYLKSLNLLTHSSNEN
jgi:acyl-CoA thioesterase I